MAKAVNICIFMRTLNAVYAYLAFFRVPAMYFWIFLWFIYIFYGIFLYSYTLYNAYYSCYNEYKPLRDHVQSGFVHLENKEKTV